MRLATVLIYISWVPILQLIALLVRPYRSGIPYYLPLAVSIVPALPAAWMLLKKLPAFTLLHKSKKTTAMSLAAYALTPLLYLFFFLLLFGVPLAVLISKLNNTEPMFFLKPAPTLALALCCIPAALSATAIASAWKEALKGEKIHIPISLFISAALSIVWLLNLGVRYYHHMQLRITGYGTATYGIWVIDTWYLETPRRIFQAVFLLLMFLFFSHLFLRIKKRAKKGNAGITVPPADWSLLLAGTGGLIIVMTRLLPFVLVKVISLLPFAGNIFLTLVLLAFSAVMGPLLLTALALTAAGGIAALFSFLKGKASVQTKKAIVFLLISFSAYAFLFQGIWPLRDPTFAFLTDTAKNNRDISWFDSDHIGLSYACMCEVFSYGSDLGDFLMEKLEDKNEYVLHFATLTAGYIQEERALPSLIKFLHHPTDSIRANAAYSLALLESPTALQPLINALRDSYREVVDSAVWGLQNINDIRAVEPLINRLKHSKRRLSMSITHALERLTLEDYKGTDENMYQWWSNWWKENKDACIKKKEAYRLKRLEYRQSIKEKK
ncbi:MAG: HEAT repeat domain-containing protein [bacterium]|nr:HEAT repeat domain-containing protein [bacterium]